MFIPIKIRGVNPSHKAKLLQRMLIEGYKKRNERPKPEETIDTDPDKAKFIETVEQLEAEFLTGGFKHA